jgi:hypothetical protein
MMHERSQAKMVGNLCPDTDRAPAADGAVADVVPGCCGQLLVRSGIAPVESSSISLPRTEPGNQGKPNTPSYCCR